MEKVLVIEDSHVQRKLITEMLVDGGYDVKSAEDGTSGIELYLQFSAKIIITDLMMPDKEGLELILQLRNEMKDFGVKIIAISSNQGYLETAKLFKADRIILKPFNSDQLLTVVNELLLEV